MFLLIISLIASTTSVVSLIPQIYRTYHLKSANDISIWMLINFVICSISWIIYGLITGAFSVWATNVIMLVFAIILLVFKVRYTSEIKNEID